MFSTIKSYFFKKNQKPYYVSICCIIKDENAYLEEWINYHLKIGVEHFYLYDNESAVPIAETLQSLDMFQAATVIHFPGKSKQHDAYEHCLKNFGKNSDWIAFIDTDEFIVPKETNGNLPAFLKTFENYGGLGVNWVIFGSNGYLKKSGRPQLETFTLRSGTDWHVNSHIKSIVQPKYVRAVKNAHYFKYTRGKFCVNEQYIPIKESFSDVSINRIQLNHYFCRSLEEYEEKIQRGRADDATIVRSNELFFEFDKLSNKIKDTIILEIAGKQ